jgi:hypothetical protein
MGRLAIEFVVRRTAALAPVELVTTPSGRMRVATPELVGLDLVRYPARAGGWDNVVAVLRDIAPLMRRTGMEAALAIEPSAPDLQRLGHLLDRAGAGQVAAVLAAELRGRRNAWVPLSPGEPAAADPVEHDATWHVVVNVAPEGD